jgi:hypothetical protein
VIPSSLLLGVVGAPCFFGFSKGTKNTNNNKQQQATSNSQSNDKQQQDESFSWGGCYGVLERFILFLLVLFVCCKQQATR